jgi:NhaA family Na+:H+ antiporter
MAIPRALSQTFNGFFESEKSSGILLVGCTALSLSLTNSALGADYVAMWHLTFGGMSIGHWINDALMAVFFLLIGLELERELYVGELSKFRDALLPIVAAAGGMIVPAAIHLSLNAGTPEQPGAGIPMATDIAFALGALALLGTRVPTSLKVFVVAFAVADDLGAILIIALFYTAELSVPHLVAAVATWAVLVTLNRLRVMALLPYLVGGAVMWFLMLRSGVHATIAGVALAFAIPFVARRKDQPSPSHTLENFLHKPVAFIILPLFALANTAIPLGADWMQSLTSANSAGIAAGLVIGKPLGVTVLCAIAVAVGLCRLPPDLSWRHVFGAGLLGGIGFTMSIFVAHLAFAGNPEAINASKIAILGASLTAGLLGYLWLRLLTSPNMTGRNSEKIVVAGRR